MNKKIQTYHCLCKHDQGWEAQIPPIPGFALQTKDNLSKNLWHMTYDHYNAHNIMTIQSSRCRFIVCKEYGTVMLKLATGDTQICLQEPDLKREWGRYNYQYLALCVCECPLRTLKGRGRHGVMQLRLCDSGTGFLCVHDSLLAGLQTQLYSHPSK